jgi:hypothetical protein
MHERAFMADCGHEQIGRFWYALAAAMQVRSSRPERAVWGAYRASFVTVRDRLARAARGAGGLPVPGSWRAGSCVRSDARRGAVARADLGDDTRGPSSCAATGMTQSAALEHGGIQRIGWARAPAAALGGAAHPPLAGTPLSVSARPDEAQARGTPEAALTVGRSGGVGRPARPPRRPGV